MRSSTSTSAARAEAAISSLQGFAHSDSDSDEAKHELELEQKLSQWQNPRRAQRATASGWDITDDLEVETVETGDYTDNPLSVKQRVSAIDQGGGSTFEVEGKPSVQTSHGLGRIGRLGTTDGSGEIVVQAQQKKMRKKLLRIIAAGFCVFMVLFWAVLAFVYTTTHGEGDQTTTPQSQRTAATEDVSEPGAAPSPSVVHTGPEPEHDAPNAPVAHSNVLSPSPPISNLAHRLTLDRDMPSDGAEMNNFQATFLAETAGLVELTPSEISIEAVYLGSVVVAFQLTTDEASKVAALTLLEQAVGETIAGGVVTAFDAASGSVEAPIEVVEVVGNELANEQTRTDNVAPTPSPTVIPSSTSEVPHEVPQNCWTVYMVDTFGDGWNRNSLHITDANGNSVRVTLHQGHFGNESVCLPVSTCYHVAVGFGQPQYQPEISWSIADARQRAVLDGTAPFARKLAPCSVDSFFVFEHTGCDRTTTQGTSAVLVYAEARQWVQYGTWQTTAEECAEGCLHDSRCTGFELEPEIQCILWLDGACSRPSDSPGWEQVPSTFTYVLRHTFETSGTNILHTQNEDEGDIVIIAYTSFEEPMRVELGTRLPMYVDRLPANSDHWLENNGGEPPVSYTACSNGNRELGFRAMYRNVFNQRAIAGLRDGATLGVVGDATTQNGGGGGGEAPNGRQYFVMSDLDGFVYVSLDPVSLSMHIDASASIYVHVESSAWDHMDMIRIWSENGIGAEIVMLDATDIDHDATVVEDSWVEYTEQIADSFENITVKFGMQSISSAEQAWFDYITIRGLGQPVLSSCSRNQFSFTGFCISNPCVNSPVACISYIDSYECQCSSGWSGANCERNVFDECESAPCQHGGSCRDAVGLYTCECASGWAGDNCATNLDECIQRPCANDGVCIDTLSGYICDCAEGWTGPTTCDIEVNVCSREEDNCDSEFANCIHTGPGTHSCECHVGYSTDDEGLTCNVIDECASRPCQNAGFCNDGPLEYVCVCIAGFDDDECQRDIDECVSAPCRHGGTCSQSINSYSCICPNGWAGGNCEENVDECSSTPCLNQGACFEGVGDYFCSCAPGFDGNNCDSNLDECLSSPCANNGHCIDSADSYFCNCGSEWTGENCQDDADDCASAPCRHADSCTDATGEYSCSCSPGFEGINCAENIDDCDSNPCQNDADCLDAVGTFQCRCTTGWRGTVCSIETEPCTADEDDCDEEHANCQHSGPGIHICTCHAGYESDDGGITCLEIDECRSWPCDFFGGCSDELLGYSCACTDGYSGSNCGTDIDECASGPCLHGGTCSELVGSYTCSCPDGWAGDECQTNVDECGSHPCRNGATCADAVDAYACDCVFGWSGGNCAQDVDECSSMPCLHDGVCIDAIGEYFCECAAAYMGSNCDLEVDECASQPCQHDSDCVDAVGVYLCLCTAGWSGGNCSTNIDECIPNPCENAGVCTDGINAFSCECADGFDDATCTTVIDPCSREEDDCDEEHANCQHSGPGIHICTCHAGYESDDGG
eukprot:SAG31_NODE_2006_length_6651_cov_29.411765_1_plen_1512_part_10